MTKKGVVILLRLEQIRKSKGITQTFLAKKLGFKSVSSYSMIEKGEHRLDVVHAKVIADVFGVDIEDLLENEKKFENDLDIKSKSDSA